MLKGFFVKRLCGRDAKLECKRCQKAICRKCQSDQGRSICRECYALYYTEEDHNIETDEWVYRERNRLGSRSPLFDKNDQDAFEPSNNQTKEPSSSWDDGGDVSAFDS